MQQPAQVFERVGDALQEVFFALVESAKAIRAHRLHDPDVHIGVVKLHELGAIKRDKSGQRIQIVIQQLLSQLRGQVGLGVVQE